MTNPLAPPGDHDFRVRVESLVTRWCLNTGLAASLFGALLVALQPNMPSPGVRAVLMGGCLALALACAAARRQSRGQRHGPALLGVAWASFGLIFLVSAGFGSGVHAVVLGFLVIIIGLVCVAVSVRAGWALAACAALGMLGLALAEHTHRLVAPPPAEAMLASHLVTQWLLLGCAVAGGTLLARLGHAYVAAVAERERRLRGVLHIACDWYWEMDAQFRFTHLSEEPQRDSALPASRRIGFAPWEIDDFGLDAETMDAHRADLEAHRAFEALLLRRRDALGRTRHARVSGAPRFDERGVFVGYWGVGRDAGAEIEAERAVASSETRYRELFERTPSPLLLHRFGQVIDANAAALALFGYTAREALIGVDFATQHVGLESQARLRARIVQLESARVGEGIEPGELELRSADGRRLQVIAAGVRVDAAGGPATLSIFFDETERRIANAALRRSEATLSHLVATSPDLIALTEAASGRFVMVNRSFTRLLGWAAEEIVGRTSTEAGTWYRPEDRARLLQAIGEHDKVEAMSVLFRARSGAPVSMLVSAARFEMEGREHLVITGRDVTGSERTRLEHQAILQSASIGIAFTRGQRFVQANPHFERLLGWPRGALAGMPVTLVWPSEEDHAEVSRIATPLLAAGKPVEFERQVRRQDGSLLWARILAQAVDPTHPTQGGTIWIGEDVTERRRVEQALAAARDAAEAANRAKSAFLANTSHEIRTPLNGLLGLTRLALREDLDPARRQQYLRQIHDSAQSLADIISDILDLSKIEAGKLALESLPFDLHALLQALCRAYQELAQARGLRLEMQIAADVPRAVLGDALRTRQILSNYISNAIKFTTRGAIRIEVRRDAGDRLRFAVSDSGCGIDEATLARLFRPFTQADESTTRRYGGTGLGLSICRELASRLGGEVGVESRFGAGSTFHVILPLPQAELALPRDDGTDPSNDTAALTGARVLMVEDNAVNMMIAVALLEQWGVQVTQAGDGRAAVEAVDRAHAAGAPFAAVLMDVQMPVMSGHEAAREMRLRHDAARLPIVAITAAALVSEREAALAAGMNAFLTKPIDADKLRCTLGQVLADADALA
jgi:PAS domain S-box-containing protein